MNQTHDRRPAIAINMLTQDAGEFVVRALESCILPDESMLDEVVIVDTGSTDDSIETIRAFLEKKAKKHEIIELSPQESNHEFYVTDLPRNFPGLDLGMSDYTGHVFLSDFGTARQAGLSKTLSDFVFFLDSDDIVSPEAGIALDDVVNYLEKNSKNLAITPYVHRTSKGQRSVMGRASLGRTKKVKWQGTVHERLTLVDPDDKPVSFEGPTTIDLFDRSCPRIPHRNLKLLYRALVRETDPKQRGHILFHLGLESRERFPDKAIEYFSEFIEKHDRQSTNSIAMAYLELGKIYEIQKHDIPMAKRHYSIACKTEESPEAYLGLGRISYAVGAYQSSVIHIRKALDLSKTAKSKLLFHDDIEREGKSRIFLALSLSRLGQHEEALSVCESGQDVMPEEFSALRSILDKRRIPNDGHRQAI